MIECLCPLIHTVSILTYAQPLSPRPTGFAGKEHNMKRIITIGREFGSGGRELGRRIAGKLEIAYYDQEIITEIAKEPRCLRSMSGGLRKNAPLCISFIPDTAYI